MSKLLAAPRKGAISNGEAKSGKGVTISVIDAAIRRIRTKRKARLVSRDQADRIISRSQGHSAVVALSTTSISKSEPSGGLTITRYRSRRAAKKK